jgi:DNA-binding SARP family transcriptional activator/tetratricopeptide (TPR) repeat protein
MAHGGLSVRVLGPFEVHVRGQLVDVPRGKQRALVAALALSAGRAVPTALLAERLWNTGLPDNPRGSMQNTVMRLRRLLGTETIRTTADGYRLDVDPDAVDALRLGRLVDAASAADPATARELLADAVGLWRGEPLSGVGSDSLERDYAPVLTERYLTCLERRIDLDLHADAGIPAELVADLRELIARFPLRESLWVRFLTVLHRSGRHAEALDAYERLRRSLAETLGTDPSAELQSLHRQLLAAVTEDDQPAGPPASPEEIPAPAQLPFDVSDFLGRVDELEQATAWLTRADGPLPVCAVSGPGGVGKSAFAVHVAHQLLDHFPDGQLYAGLADTDETPRDPRDVLASFLRALGVSSTSIPDALDERAALYRTRLRGRRVLLLLDNAANEAQVRPLLPGGSGAAVLVTSRSRLAGLAGARFVRLDVLPPAQAFELLETVAGPERFSGEEATGRTITELCGRLPLAIRIAGSRLAARPHWWPADLANRLSGQRGRLDELRQGDLEVRAVFAVGYQGLDPLPRKVFRRLGMLDVPSFPSWAAAAVAGEPVEQGERLVEILTDAQLLEFDGRDQAGQVRYRFHDLLRLYARERAAAEDSEQVRSAALVRALGGWLAGSQAASALIPRPFPGRGLPGPGWPDVLPVVRPLLSDVYAWYDSERAALVSVTLQAAGLRPPELAADLSAALASSASAFLDARGYFDEWRQVHEATLTVARQAGHRTAQAVLLCDLGEVHCVQDRIDEARGCFTEAEMLSREAGDPYLEALANSSLGYLARLRSDYDESSLRYQRALESALATGDLLVQAHATQGLGNIDFDQGRIDESEERFESALALAREAGFVICAVRALRGLAGVHRARGAYDQAISSIRQAIDELGEHQNALGEAHTSLDLAGIYLLSGRLTEARTTFERWLPVFEAHSDRFGVALTRRGLGLLCTKEKRYDQARRQLEESARIFEEMELPLWQARALSGLAGVMAATGYTAGAAELADVAQSMAEKAGGTLG